jgi:hypothetical protein
MLDRNSNENMKTFNYLGSLLAYKHFIQEGIKFSFKAGNS